MKCSLVLSYHILTKYILLGKILPIENCFHDYFKFPLFFLPSLLPRHNDPQIVNTQSLIINLEHVQICYSLAAVKCAVYN